MASSSVVSKKQQSSALENIQKNRELQGGGEEEIHENDPTTTNNNNNNVATHLHLKPHSNGTPLDREVVLRRIRHRKRVRSVKNAVQALLTSPFSPNNKNPDKSAVSAPRVKWVDDAFASL